MKRTNLILALSSAYALGGLLLLGCKDEKSKHIVESKRTSPELEFLRSERYKYVTRVAAIPLAALAAIEGHSQLCDPTSGRPINLTDVHIQYAGQKEECTRKLNFALVGDTCCLVAYRQGGIGVHDVVYFIHYRGRYSFTKDIAESIDDTVQLAHFLQKQTANGAGYSNKIAPPPPWPTRTAK